MAELGAWSAKQPLTPPTHQMMHKPTSLDQRFWCMQAEGVPAVRAGADHQQHHELQTALLLGGMHDLVPRQVLRRP